MNEVYGINHTAAGYDIVGPYDNYWESIRQLNPRQTNAKYEEFVVSTYKENLAPLWGKGPKVTTAKICSEIGARYLIDDSFDHCQLAAASGKDRPKVF